MNVEIGIIFALVVIVIMQLAVAYGNDRKETIRIKTLQDISINMQNQLESERIIWAKERGELLDRIQAPSFGELKHAEIKVIKAQQGEQDRAKLEVM